jgi:hypothetical protein
MPLKRQSRKSKPFPVLPNFRKESIIGFREEKAVVVTCPHG